MICKCKFFGSILICFIQNLFKDGFNEPESLNAKGCWNFEICFLFIDKLWRHAYRDTYRITRRTPAREVQSLLWSALNVRTMVLILQSSVL